MIFFKYRENTQRGKIKLKHDPYLDHPGDEATHEVASST